ncbi:hypothetical protein BH24ACT26_BH24ACT26_04880 [soil metagenome]
MERGWVLVTDGGTGGSRDSLAAVRALTAGGYRAAITVSGAPGPTPSRHAARRVTMPVVSDPAYASAVRRAAASGNYVTVVPTSEASLTALGVALPQLLDKVGLAREAARVGLQVPPQRSFGSTQELLDAAGELDFPAIVKPTTRRYLAFQAPSPDALRRAPLDGGPAVVQPFLTEGLRAVSGVMWRGRLVAAVHERWLRIWPYPCGLASAAETTAPDGQLEDRIAALLQGYDGIFCAQLAGPYLFDLNLRIHSSHPLAVAAGVNLLALFCDLSRGRRVPVARAAPGFFYRWLEGDLRHVLGAVRSRRMSAAAALGALRPRPGAAHSTESLTDPVPMLSRLWYGTRRAHLTEAERRVGPDLAANR